MCENQTTTSPFKPNTLVSYKGGGFDGCFWQWEHAYIDSDLRFHDIDSSGYRGCDTLEKLLAYWGRYQDKIAQWKKDQTADYPGRIPDDFDLYELDDPNEMERASRVLPTDHLLGLARWFRKQGIDVIFMARCDECGKRFDAAQGEGEEPFCVGGIVMNSRKIVCPECESSFTCA